MASEHSNIYEINFSKTLPLHINYPTTYLRIRSGVKKGNEFRLRLNYVDTELRSINHILYMTDVLSYNSYANSVATTSRGMENRIMTKEQTEMTINFSKVPEAALLFDEPIDLSSDIKLEHGYII